MRLEQPPAHRKPLKGRLAGLDFFDFDGILLSYSAVKKTSGGLQPIDGGFFASTPHVPF